MAVKYTLEGLLIYLSIAAYLFAFAAVTTSRTKTAWSVYFIGFVTGVIAFSVRWYKVSHIPFQNMFEIFLSMGIFVFPLSVFCRRFLSVGLEAADMFIGALLLFAAGFVFHAEPQMLPPALQSWLFTPHVAVYLVSYVIMAKAAVHAFFLIKAKRNNSQALLEFENNTYKMVCLGFPLLTLGLVLGSWWGKLAWGDYWGWDPKESWSLASWLIFVEYFHIRYMFGRKYPRLNSLLVLTGLVTIVITLLWVNLSRIFTSLHNYAT
jgi:ABC-type transport system involved in cytochrome c biogenesis permease subunit